MLFIALLLDHNLSFVTYLESKHHSHTKKKQFLFGQNRYENHSYEMWAFVSYSVELLLFYYIINLYDFEMENNNEKKRFNRLNRCSQFFIKTKTHRTMYRYNTEYTFIYLFYLNRNTTDDWIRCNEKKNVSFFSLFLDCLR